MDPLSYGRLGNCVQTSGKWTGNDGNQVNFEGRTRLSKVGDPGAHVPVMNVMGSDQRKRGGEVDGVHLNTWASESYLHRLSATQEVTL